MKKNGFVSMTLVYTFLILFLFLMLAVLNAYTQQNKYLETIDSKIDLTINTPGSDNYCPYSIGQTFDYDFVNDFQTFIAGCKGTYKIELWGASGGGNNNKGGKGAYTSGNINLSKGTALYIYVGEKPTNVSSECNSSNQNNSFNGTIHGGCVGGGGATDIRLVSGSWNNTGSLRSRIMVAAGGGGAYNLESNNVGGAGGGLIGYTGISNDTPGTGGRQTSTNFGFGTNSTSNGGGGYYGGEASASGNAGGGSSFISGHAGCIAIASDLTLSARTDSNDIKCVEDTNDIVCSFHYSGNIFTNTVMIDGQGYSWTSSREEKTNMPKYNESGTMEGNVGNGYARITYVSE